MAKKKIQSSALLYYSKKEKRKQRCFHYKIIHSYFRRMCVEVFRNVNLQAHCLKIECE